MASKDRAAVFSHLAGAFQAGRDALHERPFVTRHLEAAITHLAQALVEAGHAELAFTVTAHGLQSENVLVGAPPVAEALVAPLMRDGVKTITFRSGLSLEEALPLAAAWIRTADGFRGTDSLATRVWDTDHSHVAMTLHPPANVLGDAHAREAEALFRGWTTTPTLPPQELVHLSDERVVPALRALEALDVVPETGVVDQDKWMRELTALTEGLTKARAHAVEHLGDALVHTGDRASTPQEVNALGSIIERLVRTLGEEHRFAEAVDAFKHAAHESHAPAGHAVVARFKSSVTSPAVMSWLVEALNTADGAGDALTGLRHMGAGAAKSLLKAEALTPDGRRRLNALIAELDAEAARSAHEAAAQTTASSLSSIARLPPAEALAAVKKALSNPDAAVRRQALEVMDTQQAVQLAEQLHERLKDANAQVRLLALRHVAELEDPTALPALLTQLHRTTVTGEERVKLYDALSRIGGPKAAAALVDELHLADAAMKVEVAKALARVDHPKVREALKTEAERLLAPAAVKAACRDALAKLGGGK